MVITEINLYHIEMSLLTPFSTSYGTVKDRELILIEVVDENGLSGWGEVVAFSTPWYTEETIETCTHILETFLIPSVLNQMLEHPSDLQKHFAPIKRNNMAKAGLDCAVWDLYAKRLQKPLWDVLGGTRSKVEAGVVVGIDQPHKMKEKIREHLHDGYKRFKIKIKPGMDYELIKVIREEFPELPLMADANSAYTLNDISLLKRLDDFNLMMIEQPLQSDDIIDHAILQKAIKTPICLDESIVSFDDARKAIELGSAKIINVKVGRVGGLTEAKRIHDYCVDKEIGLWVGGMLESGVSRAHNVALATLPQFHIPGDISASARYWNKDVIMPEVTVENGDITVLNRPGIGYEVDVDYIRKIAKKIVAHKK
ncbi:o-succinylbenzoate synthase [Priestia koreensis]|uniref:o-succinylbenzoate synthase n=1 Tax=Priestia koreensis TaxID=284581 RepID=UPI00345A428E